MHVTPVLIIEDSDTQELLDLVSSLMNEVEDSGLVDIDMSSQLNLIKTLYTERMLTAYEFGLRNEESYDV